MDAKQKQIEKQLLKLVEKFLGGLGRSQAVRALNIDASIDKDLGIDSLGRVELFIELENAFNVQLSESVLSQAQTLKDVVHAICHASPQTVYQFDHVEHQSIDLNIDLPNAKTLNEVLELHARKTPNFEHIYFQDENGDETVITYEMLYTKASQIAYSLREKGLNSADTVAIMLPSGPSFFYTFLGVLLAGGVPVPIYPPYRPDKIEEYAKREAAILKNAEARFLITFGQAKALSQLLKTFIPTLKAVVTTESLITDNVLTETIEINTDDSALIQYTSGSTGLPKGVLLSHRNLLANIRATAEAIEIKPNDIVVSWLPLYHDMGLIGTWLGSLYNGIPIVVMSPMTFLARPERWLWAIHYHRGTISAAPNFAYELCIRKLEPHKLEGLDLSSWRLAFNGAEAINPDTLRRFTKKFEPFGFKEETHFPVYGLAESAVALMFSPINDKPVVDKIDRDTFDEQKKAVPVTDEKQNFHEFVACGSAIPGHKIRLVDSNGQVVPERHVGVLQFKGPSTMRGYYLNPAATQQSFLYGWCDTGDFAYQADGQVYITGRKKDLIIAAGRNLYPEEIEAIAADIEGVRRGCVVAFGVEDKTRGTESLVVVAETSVSDRKSKEAIKHKIVDSVASQIGLPPSHVVLVKPRIIPKTSSGKLRRSSTKDLYLEGKLHKRGLAIWQQASKLAAHSAITQAKGFLFKLFDIAYTAYAMLLLILVAPFLLPVFLLVPNKLAKYIAKEAVHILSFLAFCPIKVTGKEHIEEAKPTIYAPNHASYVDALVLTAVLPTDVKFVGKKELMDSWLLRLITEKAGLIPVERVDVTQSISDFNALDKAVQQSSLVIFPEGTFAFASGLRPFKLGAFKLAAQNNIAVTPVAIKGTRRILRGTRPLLRPGLVEIQFLSPINPRGSDWDSITALHHAVRADIAKHCGEPTIDIVHAGPQFVAR